MAAGIVQLIPFTSASADAVKFHSVIFATCVRVKKIIYWMKKLGMRVGKYISRF